MTPLQKSMILKIAESELTPVNGAVPKNVDDATTWADCVIETAEDKGVFTSLKNAGLVYHTGSGRDAAVGLTAEGFAQYQTIKAA